VPNRYLGIVSSTLLILKGLDTLFFIFWESIGECIWHLPWQRFSGTSLGNNSLAPPLATILRHLPWQQFSVSDTNLSH
jgi:hypothetical protein